MHKNIIAILLVLATFTGHKAMGNQFKAKNLAYEAGVQPDSVLRHVVIFKFKEGISQERIGAIMDAFVALKDKIPQIQSLEWGVNNSPEQLNKGFTHCVLITFLNEADRDIYLPHPDHKAFGAFLGSDVVDALVVDYWN
jgi:hypothetical protein